MIKTVIFDVDDTLYSYTDCHRLAMDAVCSFAQSQLGICADQFAVEFDLAMQQIRSELPDLAAWHERTIRFLRILEKYEKPIRFAPVLDELYWGTFLRNAVPSPGIRECMQNLKKQGFRVGIGTNMTLKWQIRKVEALGLLDYVDFFVSSEEAGADKPLPVFFELCLRKAGCRAEECLFVGDSMAHDILGAQEAGMKTLWYSRGRKNDTGTPCIDHFDALWPHLSGKALFLDLDGTLLNDRKEITPGNFAALQEALRQGHRVIINTGRSPASAILQAKKLGLTGCGCYVVAFNGGSITDLGTGKEIYRQTMDKALAKELFALFAEHNVHIHTYDAKGVIATADGDEEIIKRYCTINGIPYRFVSNLEEDPSKLLSISFRDPGSLHTMQAIVQQKYGDRIDTCFSTPNLLELMPKGMNKGSAVLRLCEALGIPASNSIAVGDAENDLSMIRAAGVGVAMCNGIPSAKAAADYITQHDNNHDGIAEVVEKFLLNA